MNASKSLYTRSFVISVGIHILVALLPFFDGKNDPDNTPPVNAMIPVSLDIKEIIVNKAPLVSKEPPPPTRLPGDRDRAVASKLPEPYYPKEAINLSWEGTVKVRVQVTSKGAVSAVSLLRSSGYPVLDQAFINTVKRRYQFKPRRLMGINKHDTVVVSYRFSL